jgi:hypothetical protein
MLLHWQALISVRYILMFVQKIRHNNSCICSMHIVERMVKRYLYACKGHDESKTRDNIAIDFAARMRAKILYTMSVAATTHRLLKTAEKTIDHKSDDKHYQQTRRVELLFNSSNKKGCVNWAQLCSCITKVFVYERYNKQTLFMIACIFATRPGTTLQRAMMQGVRHGMQYILDSATNLRNTESIICMSYACTFTDDR